MERTGAIWLRRGESDRAALKAALAVLARGGILGIAPEGRRSPTRSLGPGKPGPAFLAARARVPIVPIGLVNTDRLAPALVRFERVTLQVRIGKPFSLPPLERHNVKEQLQRDTDLIMCHIAALLPPRYRGVYVAHPLLSSLIGEPSGATALPEWRPT
jgi:1-acyl-sn-glycerol-3-phosphate acyltransferase